MSISADSLIEVGVVVGTHGLRGDLKVRTLPTGDLALPAARSVYLKDGEGPPTPCRAVRISQHKQLFLLRLAECTSIEAATTMVGRSVWMPRDEVPEGEDDSPYWHDLEGVAVSDLRLGPLGTVVGMFATAAHDILEVRGPYGEVLIPAIAPFVKRLDRRSGQLLVDLPDGLVEAD